MKMIEKIKLAMITTAILSFQFLFALEESYFQKEKFDFPYREQAIIVTGTGFYPNRISVFKGERVRFFITALGDTKSCFNLDYKNVYSTATNGKLTEVETFFDKAGTFVFSCPNFSHHGRILVLEKEKDKEETLRRGLASDVIKVWQPKEKPSEWVEIRKDELKNLRGMGDVLDLDEK